MRTAVALRALLIVAVVAAILMADTLVHGHGPSPAIPPGLAATIAVEPVVLTAPAPRAWQPVLFAESLSSRLARTPGLSVPEAGAEFTVRTEATTRDSRLVVAIRLHRRGEDQPVWSATFWRRDEATTAMVQYAAADVAEAVFGYLGRRAVREEH